MQGNKHKPLILQDYLTFYSGGCADNLTISQLKKILSIHGFTQLGNSSKEDIIEAVRSLHMTPPVRTTTSTNSVPLISLHAAALSVQEVTRDMQVIGWEECPVQSVKTIEPKVPAMSPSLSFVRPVPRTNANLKEKDNGALSICELPSLKFSKKARTVVKKRADKCSWRFSGCMNISGVPYKRSRNDERSDLQSSVGEEGANKYVKELISGEIATIQVLAKSSKNADPYTWRASGSMRITGFPYNRRYYKCSEIGCFAKKHIDRDASYACLLLLYSVPQSPLENNKPFGFYFAPGNAEIMDVVRSLHLSPPVRSTLRTNIVPLLSLCTASLYLEEMREDLHTIGWDKFTVQSVVTVETAAPSMSIPYCCAVPDAEKNGNMKEIEK